jgi:hypothetical protein
MASLTRFPMLAMGLYRFRLLHVSQIRRDRYHPGWGMEAAPDPRNMRE